VKITEASAFGNFDGDRYWRDIHPSWLETPERRGELWEMFARIAELEEDE
jgi:hypothetical protein